MSYRVSDLSNSDLYVLQRTGGSTGRLVRLYNDNDMYRERYDSYSEDSDYSSEYSSDETESEYYESPRQIRLVLDKQKLNGRKRIITSGINRHTIGNKNSNYRNSTTTPSSDRIVYPSTKYVSRTEPGSESNSNSINSEKRLKIVKVIPVQETYYPGKLTRVRSVRYVGGDGNKARQVYVARKIIDSEKPVPERQDIYRQSISKRRLNNARESPSTMQEIGHVVKPNLRSDRGFREIPLPIKYSERQEFQKLDKNFKPRDVSEGNVRKTKREEILVYNENKQGSLNTYRSGSTEKQRVIPLKQYEVPVKQNPVISKHSFSSFDTISESDDTESSDSDSESTVASTQNETKPFDTNQTSRLLLDYSKMLTSREEQRRYEKERKQHEHETNIVTCVQKEINKPVKSSSKSDNTMESTNSSTSKLSSNSEFQPSKKEPKPLPSNNKARESVEDQEQIKTIIRIDERRRRKMEERNRLVAWTESENNNDNYSFQLKNVKKCPTVYDFDTCRHSTLKKNNRQDEPDNIEVRVNYEDDFDKLYPKPRNKGAQQVYYIDLTKPPEIIEPKPFDVDKRRIVLQPKKKHEGPLVKVGGGWNTLDNYMERHVPVKRFVYPRSPESKDKYYGFQSNYKSPRSNLDYRPL